MTLAPSLAPSPWIIRWSHLIQPGDHVLDVACGTGRHVRWFAQHGCRVTGIDRNTEALAPLQALARVVASDLETAPWPLGNERFDAVIVTHYLWRPLLPTLINSVAPGGVLLYETFSAGHQRQGRPIRPEFVLQPGELLRTVDGQLDVLGYECGHLDLPERVVQRIAARCPAPTAPAAIALPQASTHPAG